MASTRRSFLAASAAAAGSLVLPSCAATRRVQLPRDPAQPMRLMVVGVGGRGGDNLNAVAKQDIRVLCDVDRGRLRDVAKRFPGARTVLDFREILRDPVACRDLDGVVVSTPDHTHFAPAMLALRQGLDVYCEKPLTHTVTQARALLRTAEANGCITQMGIQIHANENYHRVVEAVRAGAVGTVREVVVFVNGTDWSATELPKPSAAPADLDWDLWLGPAAERPYAEGFHPAGWRRYWAFGGGTTADMACHFVDLAFWALELDAPTSLAADGDAPHPDCAPRGMRCEYAFPARGDRPAVTLRWHAGSDRPAEALASRGLQEWRNGVLFVGDQGWLISDYNKHRVGPDARAAEWKAPPPSLAKSIGHHEEWVRACALRSTTSTPFAYAAPLTETVLLANVALRAARGKKLSWDAAALRTDDAAANALLAAPARAGFDV
ncbi:MAG: Gfo/Idh/MocA family oxidoreductase [Planctomycetes bacterium]|nr:Gfo/Idh/MocA family oxidoreductase [Planctomycetota bacterium]